MGAMRKAWDQPRYFQFMLNCQRDLVETAVGCYKTIIGPRLQERSFSGLKLKQLSAWQSSTACWTRNAWTPLTF
jgi:hypothetical protein